uniref:Membrane associated guanylate kinase, WW and PDZ domain containing 3b n=1 Tax=Mesocestoides corti TaxID=53468 RepID=A0A5K3EL51_MESCO
MSQVAVHLSDGRPSQTALPVEHPTSLDSGIYEVLLSAASSCKSAPFPIEGGSDSGMFCLIGNAISPCQLVYHPIISSPKKAPSILRPGDVILEIGEYQISGFTRLDAIRLCEALFNSDSKGNRPRILLKLIPPSALPSGDVLLNHFLSSHFQVGTPEFLLQEVTRNNIYQRVVPCTTRAPRPEERDGVDYQFLGVDHFLALEKSGQLIESGIYKGNHYGTPRPDPSSTVLNVERRRRSPVGCDNRSPGPNSTNDDNTVPVDTLSQSSCDDDSQRRNAPSVPLPNGWEVIDHPEYGLFYVDHIHQKTQYEPPTQADFEEAARLEAAGSSSSTASTFSVDNDQQRAVTAAADSSSGRLPATDRFTTDVSQLRGPLTTAVLVKGPKGFGFTIVGGSSPSQPGFLQVKNLIPGGSAALEGTLSVGNVLVSANGVNVLGFSHDEIVSLFQSIPVGNTVSLTVSQGYTLSNGNCFDGQKKQPQTKYALPVMETYRTADRSVPFAPPELCIRRLNTSPTISQLSGEPPLPLSPRQHQSQRFEFVQVSVVKKANGFGFTLADQAQGQRVKEVIEPTGLRIGDVIVEVNDKWVKDASHVEVVQLLKACPVAKPTKFLIQRGLPNSTKKNHLDSDFNPNFTRISTCDSPNGIYGTCNDFSPTNSFYPVCQPVDCSMVQSVTSAGSSRYRSRTPGPGDSHNSRLASSGGGGGTAVMGSSSDCIYSLGESLSGLDLCRSPSLTLQSPSMAAPPGSLVPAAFGGGLKRYGGTDFDAYCMQQGLSRNNPSGSGHVLQLNPNYASLPRNAHGPPHPLGEFLVCLRREANGFGFKILGGSEEGTQVTIGQLMPGGAAEKSGLIRPGDHLVSVNGERVYGGSHARALALLEQECDTEVTLGLWRPTAPPTRDSRPTEANEARRLASSAVRHAVLHRAPDEEGFGFVLAYPPPLSKSTTSVSGRAQGDGSSKPLEHFISRVLPGSASERSRLLRVGDRLLSVNGVSVTGLRHEDVIRLIKDSGTQVALTVLPHTPIPTYEHHQTRMACPSRQAVFFQVTLFRSNRGFGFSIRGGHEFNQMPLTVLRVAEGGPAHLDGRLKVGDELLQINGYTTTGMSHRRAVEIIQAGGNMISLGVRRFLVGDQKAPSFYPQSPLPFVSPPFMPPGPPNLRFPQFFTPLPVHRPAFVQKPLLSSVVQ